ncbi:MAG TPA: hypothetical protein VLT32_21005, partial [Candidatus Sulfomarinibacteraceae bacterium]|nr:hypothetical protein [Candidatus Sulfomarinibacteraceae bacterium]
VVYAVQAVATALAIVLLGHAVSRRLSPAAGVAAAAVLAVNVYQVLFSAILASENLCFWGVCLLAWLLLARDAPLPRSRWLAAALVVGLLALVRSAMLGLAPGVAALAAFAPVAAPRPSPRARWLTAVLVLGVAVAPSVIYGAVRAERVGAFRIGSPWDAYNLWLGNNPHATGRIDPMPEVPDLGRTTRERYAVARELSSDALAYALRHPLDELRLAAARASYLFAPPKRDLIYIYGWGWAGERPPWVVWGTYLLSAATWSVLLVLAIVGWARTGWRPTVVVAVVLVAAGLAPYLVAIGDARFLMPLYPLVAVVAAAAVLPTGRPPAARTAVAAVLLALVLGNAAVDLAASHSAVAEIARPGGSGLRPPYHFAR